MFPHQGATCTHIGISGETLSDGRPSRRTSTRTLSAAARVGPQVPIRRNDEGPADEAPPRHHRSAPSSSIVTLTSLPRSSEPRSSAMGDVAPAPWGTGMSRLPRGGRPQRRRGTGVEDAITGALAADQNADDHEHRPAHRQQGRCGWDRDHGPLVRCAVVARAPIPRSTCSWRTTPRLGSAAPRHHGGRRGDHLNREPHEPPDPSCTPTRC